MSGYNANQASISFSASGDNTVIAAVAGASIKIWGLSLAANSAANLIFKDNTLALTGVIDLIANGSITWQPNGKQPWFYCQPGDAFKINSSTTAQVSGTIYYSQGG